MGIERYDERRDLSNGVVIENAPLGDLFMEFGPPAGEDWRVLMASISCNAAAGITEGVWYFVEDWDITVPGSGVAYALSDIPGETLAADTLSFLYARAVLHDSIILHSGEALRYDCLGVGAGDLIQYTALYERRLGVEPYAA